MYSLLNNDIKKTNEKRCCMEITHQKTSILPKFEGCMSFGVELGNYNNEIICQLNKDRFCHTAIVGKSGSGKSNLIHQMEIQDIKSEAGLAIIASHPEDALYPLSFIPKERVDDVVIIDATDNIYLPCINPLDVDLNDKKEVNRAIEKTIDLMTSNIPESYAGPRFKNMARNGLRLIMEPGNNGVPYIGALKYIFTDPEITKKYLKNCRNREVFNYWTKEFPASQTSDDAGSITSWFLSKVDYFTNNNTLAALFAGKHKTINFKDIVKKGKILVVLAPETIIGHDASLYIKTVVLNELKEAIITRSDNTYNYGIIRNSANSTYSNCLLDPFYLYIDEFGEVASEEFCDFFSQVRKFNVGLIVGFQNFDQLETIELKTINNKSTSKLLHSVLGNTGTIIAFNTSKRDSDIFISNFGIDGYAVPTIKKYQALGMIRIDGETKGPYTLTIPLQPKIKNNLLPSEIYKRLIHKKIINKI